MLAHRPCRRFRAWLAASSLCLLCLAISGCGLTQVAPSAPSAPGPLKVSQRNPRYFEDPNGHVVYLTGAHTWATLEDQGFSDPPPVTDFAAYLDLLQRRHHNLIRLWAGENFMYNESTKLGYAWPLPYLRTGPGNGLDGKPKFDLTRYDPEYFKRLRQRCIAAGQRGIYVSIMLFEGWQCAWGASKSYNYPWAYRGNPYHPANNINGIDPGLGASAESLPPYQRTWADPAALAVHTMAVPAVVAMEEAYVRHVIDTVNDLDNILYEISNESTSATVPWQYHMIDVVRNYERTKPKQHPIGMSAVAEPYGKALDTMLFRSQADWVAPGGSDIELYGDNSPGADGRKVIIADTDHLQPGEAFPRVQTVWKTATRGMNFLYMDEMDPAETGDLSRVPVRKNMGLIRSCVERMDLATATPRNALASTRYCLSDGKTQFLIFLPQGGRVTVDLRSAQGRLNVEWVNTTDCKPVPATPVSGGGAVTLTAPFDGPAGLFIYRP